MKKTTDTLHTSIVNIYILAILTPPIVKGGVFMELAKETTKQTRKIVAAIVVALVIFVVSLVMRKRSN